ncbi:MAG TPA: ATP-dependent RNA helicase [Opitutaceae bacterium]|nr:ATP-dependent RNA helicase [Opitutaceae bacterium]
MPDPRELPIYEIRAALLDGARATGRVVVQAPTGSGKSTQVPKMLLSAGLLERGQCVVLQPRRIAARMLAKRVAQELGVRLGDEVGYQVRLDSRVSNKTRIRYVTEGILLRQMTFDAHLRGVSALVFDEFHERHLDGDIGLARALQIQRTTRPDLIVIVMSATLDAGLLQQYLAPCSVVRSEGRMFPVAVEYETHPINPDSDDIWDVAARACARVVAKQASGDVLVFMPGAYEINRAVNAIQYQRELKDCLVFSLHGEMSPDDQDRAVERYERRKIIVATNVAETSLTIDGVTAVVDSGLARLARFDPHRGINTLLVEKISAASADQRAGRAGRTAPGVCLRLWTEREHTQRAPQELPEVKRLDLAEVVLTLKAAGIDDVVNFPWIEPPDPKALARAEDLLRDLGAVAAGKTARTVGGALCPDSTPSDELSERESPPTAEDGRSKTAPLSAVDGEGGTGLQTRGATRTGGKSDMGLETHATSITEIGRRMLKFPVHPRYARMFLAAAEYGCVRTVAMMAALTQGRSFWLRNVDRGVEQAREDLLGTETESDFFLLMRAYRYAEQSRFSVDACRRLGIHAQAARQVGPLFEQFLEIAQDEGLDVGERRVDGALVRKCVLLGFIDHLARRLDEATLRCALVHRRRGLLARESALHGAKLLVVAEISEIGGRAGEVNTVLGLATAIEEAWLKELFPDDCDETVTTGLDPSSKRVTARRERRFRDLVLESREGAEPPETEAAQILARLVLAGDLKIEAWDEKVEEWIVRVARFAEWFPEMEAHPIRDEDREMLVEQMCYGCRGVKDVRNLDPWPILKDWLTPEQLAAMETLLPERIEMANGRRSKISYPKEGPPVISARIQELFGVEKLSLARGRVPLKIEVLAPNQRPIQVTDDLARFWLEVYPEIKPALSRRYPRHEWR